MADTEARVILFSEFRRKVGDSWDVEHLTLRAVNGMTNEETAADFKWWEAFFANMGYEHCDAPKQQFNRGGGAGGGQHAKRKDPVEIIAEGDKPTGKAEFEIHDVWVWTWNEKKNIKAGNVDGTESVCWDGKQLDALMKTLDSKVSTPFLNWAEWKEGERHPVGWKEHKLIAKCVKSTSGKWSITAFEVR